MTSHRFWQGNFVLTAKECNAEWDVTVNAIGDKIKNSYEIRYFFPSSTIVILSVTFL